MTFTLLEGIDGRKMSSSWGNVININDAPNDIYGKTMGVLDYLIGKYLLLCTRLALTEVKEIEKKIQVGLLNPRDAKALLAKELVRMYHGDKAAMAAEEYFEKVHRSGSVPEDIKSLPLAKFSSGSNRLLRLIMAMGAATSMSEARRKTDQGGVKINGQQFKKYDYEFKSGDIIQVGPLKWIKLK